MHRAISCSGNLIPFCGFSTPFFNRRSQQLTEASEHISFSISQGLPLLKGDEFGNFFLKMENTKFMNVRKVPTHEIECKDKAVNRELNITVHRLTEPGKPILTDFLLVDKKPITHIGDILEKIILG